MANELPEKPESREESYLADIAGQDVVLPEKPMSRKEQYLAYIAENGGGGGGGGSYTAGDGIDITNDTISVDTDTIQEKLTAGTGIDITDNTISATGGGGPTVVQTTGTSTTDVMSQDATTKLLYPLITMMPDTINIRGASGPDTSSGTYAIGIGAGSIARGERSISIGFNTQAYAGSDRSVAIGNLAKTNGNSKGIAIGNLATCSNPYSIAFGSSAKTSRIGEVNIGAGTSGEGYNSTNYRVIGGVHDGQSAQDAVTVNQVNATIDAINTALSTSIPHIGASS